MFLSCTECGFDVVLPRKEEKDEDSDEVQHAE
jgi:hypothetical protein